MTTQPHTTDKEETPKAWEEAVDRLYWLKDLGPDDLEEARLAIIQAIAKTREEVVTELQEWTKKERAKFLTPEGNGCTQHFTITNLEATLAAMHTAQAKKITQ